jgi:hypothetical protein
MAITPNNDHIFFLKNNHFLRNPPIDTFVKRLNNQISLSQYICYNVGYINDKKFIQSFQILNFHTTGIQNYRIRWWNTAFIDENSIISDYVDFWVHSGSALRTNFFLFEDRFSLFRSTFIYDTISETFFRLFTIENFLVKNELFPLEKIYHSPSKFNYIQKRKKSSPPKKCIHKTVRKHLKNFLKQFASSNILEKKYAPLFREIGLILSIDGSST